MRGEGGRERQTENIYYALTHSHMTTIGPCLSLDIPCPLLILSITSSMRMTEGRGGRPCLGHDLKWNRFSLRVRLKRWRKKGGGYKLITA